MDYFLEENIPYKSTVSNINCEVFSDWNRFKNFLKRNIFNKITIFEDFLFIFKIGNGRVVENIFLEKLSHNLWISNHF